MQNLIGLTSKEAREKLKQFGPNSIQEDRKRPIRLFLQKLWGPLPWMLEIIFFLQLSLGKDTETIVTLILLLFNACIGFVQEYKAQIILSLLKKNLKVKARVMRDGNWAQLDAEDIVPEDLIRIRMGDFVPADIIIKEGSVLADQSTITGESVPVEHGIKERLFSGSIIKRGEATGEVIATGKRSFFGKTAELVRTAKESSQLERVVLDIVKFLVAIDVLLVGAIGIYAVLTDIHLREILPFALVLLIASVPVALPATFTLMSAAAAQKLAGEAVLVTRLSAIEEVAAMQVLCADKTGTLTVNQLKIEEICPQPPFTHKMLLECAALASRQASQDPLDYAIIVRAKLEGCFHPEKRLTFIPFDPAVKRSEAFVKEGDKVVRVVKGSPAVIAELTRTGEENLKVVERYTSQGFRVLSVAAGEIGKLQYAGCFLFSDHPREDSKAVVGALNDLGVNVKMVTGDNPATAMAIAAEVGIGQRICRRDKIQESDLNEYDIFAEVFPEDKFYIVEAFQKEGMIVGMTGDGVNDAPALKQANVGVAMSNATDVAKAAAGVILTQPGLHLLINALKSGREVYRRMRTYTLNKIIKTTHIALFLSLGLLITDVFVTTPRLVMFLIFANDFVTMSLASDRVRMPLKPCRWNIRFLGISSLIVGFLWLLFSFGVFYAGRDWFHLSLPAIQTLVFLLFVFSGLATVYLVRTQEYFWKIQPGNLLLCSTFGDIVVVSSLAYFGILMEPLELPAIILLLLCVFTFMVCMDVLKVFILRKIGNSNI